MIRKLGKTFFILFFLNTYILASDSIKPIIVERISQFMEWPKQNKEFVIGIYQNKKLKDQMIESYKNKTIQKLPIKVFNIKNNKDTNLEKANLLYFTKELSNEVENILKRLKNKPILIITDFPNDVYNGMDLGLFYENKRIKFIINQEGLKKKKLKASYKLLKLAKIVKEGK